MPTASTRNAGPYPFLRCAHSVRNRPTRSTPNILLIFPITASWVQHFGTDIALFQTVFYLHQGTQMGLPEAGPPPRLGREIGLLGLTAYGVGAILGAGIYALIGTAAGIAEEGLWLACLLSALIALLTGFSYAELATMYPRAGAEYHFVRHGFGSPRLAFLAGWMLIAGATAAVATLALAFGGYFEQITGVPSGFSAFILIGLLSAINFVGIRQSTLVNIVLTFIEGGGLVLIVILGLTRGIEAFIPGIPEQPGAVASAAALLFFSYMGFEQIANVAEESKHPERVLPLALLGAIAISAVLYVMVSLAVIALASPEKLAASPAPLALAATTVLGPIGSTIMSVIALFAITNTVLLVLVASSRLVYGIAREGTLPRALTDINPSTRTPGAAVALLMLVSWIFLPLGSVRVVGSLSSFSALFVFTLVNLALVRLRYTRPEVERPFRSPISIGRFPILALLGALTAAVASLLLDSNVILIGTAILLVGLIAAFVLPTRPK